MGSRHWRIPIPWLCVVRFLTFLHLVLLLMYSHSASHAHPAPSSQRRSPVPAIVDNAQEDKAYSVLTITMRHSKIRNKDVHVRYFTSSSAAVPQAYPRHLQKPRGGPLSLRICISIGKDHLMSKRGSGSAMAALRQVVPGVRSKQGIRTLACRSISSKC